MKANSDALTSSTTVDKFKWVLVFFFLAIAVVGNQVYSDTSIVIRAIVVTGLIVLAMVLFVTTNKGKDSMGFVREAKVELRKIVWPTRQETIRMTLVVLAVSMIMTVVLWALDMIMVKLISFITGV